MTANKILTVDDSRTIRMIVKKAFSPFKCELFEAQNGVEGLDLATKVKPDLIVLDITMPVMTGIEMLTRLKEENDLKNIPVIMLTAESGKDNVMAIVKMGVRDYIVKPFKGEQLIERVKQILELQPRIETHAKADSEKEGDYFTAAGDIVVMSLPKKVNRSIAVKAENAAKNKIDKLSSAGAKKFIIDVSAVADLNMNVIQMLNSLINLLERSKMIIRLVATDSQRESLKGFKETGSVETLKTVEQALTSF
ncbi:MAG: response regulator [Desulfobacteraceae bacterium]|nr:response regulator [Desulfobacteraceae bacterium]